MAFLEVEENFEKSTFNEAALKMRRLHTLQENINKVRSIPLHWNDDIKDYNYNYIFANLNSLLLESWGKLTDKERTEVDKLRSIIQRFIRTAPPHKTSSTVNNSISKVTIDFALWYKLEDMLLDYEKRIKDCMDKHGLSTPSDDDYGLLT